MHRLVCLAASLLLALPTFAQVSFNVTRLSQQLNVVGDFNNDGREDGIVFTGTASTGTHGFHAEISSGTAAYFAAPSYTFPNGEAMETYAVADFNNDGKLDLVIATGDSKLLVYLGEGNGSFQSPKTIALPFLTGSIQPADVNHDGKMDLVMVNGPSNQAATLVSYFGDGKGGFTAGPSSSFDYNYALNGMGDFDGDGKADMMTANCGPGGCNFTVYYGDGTGKFGSPVQVGTGQSHFSIADVDGDGLSDIIATNEHYINGSDAQYLLVFYGVSDRTLQQVTVPTSQCAFERPVVADFNGDHMPDIIFSEHDCVDNPDGHPDDVNAQIAILPGTGSRTNFGTEQTIYWSHYSQQPGYDTRVMRANNSDTKPDFYFSETADSSGQYPARFNVMVNNVNQNTGTFAMCKAPNSVAGFNICSPKPGSTTSTIPHFSIGASGSVPMRKVEVWSDGTKLVEDLYAFSDYAFLDEALNMTPGSHNITLVSAGWDNSLQSKSFSIFVQGSGNCTTGNTITVCQPPAKSTVSSPVQISASTTLGNPVYRFELWNGSTKLVSVANNSSMNTTVSLSSGTHKLAFVARLADGTRRELDITITVK